MKTKVLLAALGGGVAAFLLGWLIFGMLLMDYYTANTTHYDGLMKEMPTLWAIFLSNFFWALLLAWVFDKMGVKSVSSGAMNGAILSLLFIISVDLYLYSTMNLFGGQIVAIDVVINTILWTIVGAVIGWILGMGTKPAAATT